jgi:hypothetical protein
MKTHFKVSTSVLALSVLLTGLAFAYQFNSGALKTDVPYEDKVSFGPDMRFNFARNQLQVPKAYGRLVSITAASGVAILWFESNDGSIRNVYVDAGVPVIVDRKGELN